MAVIALTGHRPDKLGGYGHDAAKRVDAVARFVLSALAPDKVISGMALGWDQAGARAAVDLGVPLVVAVPFAGQESRWPDASRAEYARLLSLAQEIRIISSGPYASWKMQRRNEWMVDNCNLLVALWDGTTGGTRNCVEYARSTRRPFKNYWRLFARE